MQVHSFYLQFLIQKGCYSCNKRLVRKLYIVMRVLCNSVDLLLLGLKKKTKKYFGRFSVSQQVTIFVVCIVRLLYTDVGLINSLGGAYPSELINPTSKKEIDRCCAMGTLFIKISPLPLGRELKKPVEKMSLDIITANRIAITLVH